MSDKPTITDYLASLGTTPDEIADSLRAQDIKGKQKSQKQGIICNAINTQCNAWPGLKVYGDCSKQDTEGHWYYRATYNDCQIMDPRLPKPIQDFLGLFDQGKYPHLVAKSVKTGTYISWE